MLTNYNNLQYFTKDNDAKLSLISINIFANKIQL
jgi:hypothetical protein